MRTLKGYEAIDMAERFDISLFDVQFRTEVTIEQAMDFIRSRRSADTFVIENWPDSEAEAERLVLQAFHTALLENNLIESGVQEAFEQSGLKNGIHPMAAELAARRLLEQNELEMVKNTDNPIYRLPRAVFFKADFLNSIGDLVCDECAHLNLDKPFHKACLATIVEYLKETDLSLADITELRLSHHMNVRLPEFLKPKAVFDGFRGLRPQAKLGWKSVLRPVFNREGEDEAAPTAEAAVTQDTIHFPSDTTKPEASDHVNSSDAVAIGRPRVTKEELIRYLQNVEIQDEDGELTRLRIEREDLLKQIGAKEREMQQLQRQRAYFEQQCAEMQRDLDTLLEAMQIAKRRGHEASRVIDADIDTEE